MIDVAAKKKEVNIQGFRFSGNNSPTTKKALDKAKAALKETEGILADHDKSCDTCSQADKK